MMRILYVYGYNGSPTGSSYTLFDKQLDKSIYELHTIDYDAADPGQQFNRFETMSASTR